MKVTQWRIEHSSGVDGWLVIEGLGSDSHQTAIREAYAHGHIVDGPAELLFEDDDYGTAMRYPLLRIKGGPGQVPIPRAGTDEERSQTTGAAASLTPGDAGGRYRT